MAHGIFSYLTLFFCRILHPKYLVEIGTNFCYEQAQHNGGVLES